MAEKEIEEICISLMTVASKYNVQSGVIMLLSLTFMKETWSLSEGLELETIKVESLLASVMTLMLRLSQKAKKGTSS
jgi:hypothetical protein